MTVPVGRADSRRLPVPRWVAINPRFVLGAVPSAEQRQRFDGRYKFGRYHAPTAYNTPRTMEEIFKNNDVQLFDLQNDSLEVQNLALDREKNQALIDERIAQ